jgi:ribosomal protein S18 acetylase RimI-like enzyme
MTVDTLTIRPATAADADAVALVLAEAFAEFQPLYTPAGYQATTPARQEIAQRFADGPIWVVEQDGRLAGTISAILREDGVYLRGMAVAPAARGCGVGRALLSQVQEFAAANKRQHLYLSTTPFLSSAIRLYERAGFIPTSAPPYELFGTPLFTMEKWSNSVDVR